MNNVECRVLAPVVAPPRGHEHAAEADGTAMAMTPTNELASKADADADKTRNRLPREGILSRTQLLEDKLRRQRNH